LLFVGFPQLRVSLIAFVVQTCALRGATSVVALRVVVHCWFPVVPVARLLLFGADSFAFVSGCCYCCFVIMLLVGAFIRCVVLLRLLLIVSLIVCSLLFGFVDCCVVVGSLFYYSFPLLCLTLITC